MSRNKMSGFTLIELMVVIVIIGVLASLAIPRFTEASMKAKIQDAPKVLASYETSFLAAVAEHGEDVTEEKMMFKRSDGNWYKYEWVAVDKCAICSLKADGPAAKKGINIIITSKYNSGENGFERDIDDTADESKKQGTYVANFIAAAQVSKKSTGTGTTSNGGGE